MDKTNPLHRLILGGLGGLLLVLWWIDASSRASAPVGGVVLADPVTVGTYLAIIAVSALISWLLTPDITGESVGPIKDTNPSQTATRGVFAPSGLGRHVLAPIQVWVGNRTTKTEGASSGGGKGGEGANPGQLIYFEEGCHVLCVGPAYKLWEIRSGNDVIFEGPITQETHPTGTDVELDDGSRFEIYWGERKGPTDSWLGSDDRVGVVSSWPHLCRINWRSRRLGEAAYWGQMKYDIEIRPQSTGLAGSSSWISDQKAKITAEPFAIVDALAGDEGVGYFAVSGKHKAKFKPDSEFYLSGNAEDEGIYRVLDREYNSSLDRTLIYPNQTLDAPDVAGIIERLEGIEAGGANVAHAFAHFLFNPYPLGRGLNPSRFDFQSLERLGIICEEEGLTCSIIGLDGQSFQGVIASMQIDFGVQIVYDDGRYVFRLIRAPEEDEIIEIPAQALLSDTPQQDFIRGGPSKGRIQFELVHNFRKKGRTDTIVIDADNYASEEEFKATIKVPIVSTTSKSVANRIAERRSQEDLAPRSGDIIEVGREGRRITAGKFVRLPGEDEIFLVMSRLRKSGEVGVDLEIIPNSYGITLSDFSDDDEIIEGNEEEVYSENADTASFAFELPCNLSPGTISIGALASRTLPSVTAHLVYLSADDITYTVAQAITSHPISGTLDVDLNYTSGIGGIPISIGPTVTMDNADVDGFAGIQDLTSNATGWLTGAQLMIVVDEATGSHEIIFLRNALLVGTDVLDTRDLVRARMGTIQRTWLAGSRVYILPGGLVQPIINPLISGATTVYAKIVPVGGGESPTLGEVDSHQIDIETEGLGSTGNNVQYVYGQASDTDAPFTWKMGFNLVLLWGWADCAATAGVVATDLPTGHVFFVSLYTSPTTPSTTPAAFYLVTTGNFHQVTNTDFVNDLGAEPASVWVEVSQIDTNTIPGTIVDISPRQEFTRVP